jgi:hypothetical protein
MYARIVAVGRSYLEVLAFLPETTHLLISYFKRATANSFHDAAD